MKTPPPSGENRTRSQEDTEGVTGDFRPVAFYIPVNPSPSKTQSSERRKKRTKSKRRENSEERDEDEDDCNFRLNHEEKMLQADILHQDQLNEKGM